MWRGRRLVGRGSRRRNEEWGMRNEDGRCDGCCVLRSRRVTGEEKESRRWAQGQQKGMSVMLMADRQGKARQGRLVGNKREPKKIIIARSKKIMYGLLQKKRGVPWSDGHSMLVIGCHRCHRLLLSVPHITDSAVHDAHILLVLCLCCCSTWTVTAPSSKEPPLSILLGLVQASHIPQSRYGRAVSRPTFED